jgi:hypothetical protein
MFSFAFPSAPFLWGEFLLSFFAPVRHQTVATLIPLGGRASHLETSVLFIYLIRLSGHPIRTGCLLAFWNEDE